MSNLSSLTLNLKPSRYFLCLITSIHLIACALMFRALSVYALFVCLGLLINYGYCVKRDYRRVLQIDYRAEQWFFSSRLILAGTYQHCRVVMQARYYKLLEFQSPTQRRRVMIFADQLSQASWHKLSVITNTSF